MLRTELDQLAFDRFLRKMADALGVSIEVAYDSEVFEQAVYDMAKAEQALPDVDVKHHAHYGFKQNMAGRDCIRIIYECQNVDTKKMAAFYNKHFPETQPEFTYGLESAIYFERQAFIQKVLPTMKIWRTRPSCLKDNNLHFVESGKLLLISALAVNFGDAVFISGADPVLGKWETAQRMTYNEKTRQWEMAIPAGTANSEFKFLTGAFDLGEKVKTSQLSYEAGTNRMLIVFDPSTNPQPQQSRPVGYGIRC